MVHQEFVLCPPSAHKRYVRLVSLRFKFRPGQALLFVTNPFVLVLCTDAVDSVESEGLFQIV